MYRFEVDTNGMFPTHVGMNRIHNRQKSTEINVPHTRGDEPCESVGVGQIIDMFPTHVGMNRSLTPVSNYPYNVPHTRGDEPE